MKRLWYDVESQELVSEDQLYEEYMTYGEEYDTFEDYVLASGTRENGTLLPVKQDNIPQVLGLEYVSVTVNSTVEGPCDYKARTAVFTNRDAAENFKNDLECMFENADREDDFCVTIDSGSLDSTAYKSTFMNELVDGLMEFFDEDEEDEEEYE